MKIEASLDDHGFCSKRPQKKGNLFELHSFTSLNINAEEMNKYHKTSKMAFTHFM